MFLLRDALEALLQMFNRRKLVAHFAEPILNFVHGGGKLLMRQRRQRGRRQLEGVPQSFAGNPDGVQCFGVAQIGIGKLEKLTCQRLKLLAAERAERRRVAAGMALGPANLFEQSLDKLFQAAVALQTTTKVFQFSAGPAALARQLANDSLGNRSLFVLQAL